MKEIESPDFDLKAEVKKCKTMEDVVGKNGLMQRLLKGVMQEMLEGEMEELLGREKYKRTEVDSDINYRNGYSDKNIKSSFGNVEIDIPRDRNVKFEPKILYLIAPPFPPLAFPA